MTYYTYQARMHALKMVYPDAYMAIMSMSLKEGLDYLAYQTRKIKEARMVMNENKR